MLVVKDSMKNGMQYDGNTFKFGITVDGIDYIVKFQKGHSMSVYSEYVCSRFIQSLGIPCHEVHLGSYNGNIVNVIKDFTTGTNLSLHSFKSTKQSSEDTDISAKEYTYNDVLYLIDKHLKLTDLAKQDAKVGFWNMFICDAIIGNKDRHWGNWGYLCDGNNYRLAPLYDNGGGLFPGVYKVMSQYIDKKQRKKFLYDRVFTFPASLFMVRKTDRSYRTNYYEMFSDLRINKVFASQVNTLKQRFTGTDIFNIITNIVFPIDTLSKEYKYFYIEIITLRYMCIILREDFDKCYEKVERWLNL